MSLSSILKQECSVCGKIALESSRMTLGRSVIIKLACGHLSTFESLVSEQSAYDTIVSSDGFRPRSYQIEAVKFAEAANLNFICADEQGLGKTWVASCILRLHKAKALPAIVVCPTTVKKQWMRELIRICGNVSIQVVESTKEMLVPGFDVYIITFDMLKKKEMFSILPPKHIKTLVIDECQRIKNHLSDRAKAIQHVVQSQEIAHVIPMSGTPIKNHAGEYFTVLNLVDRKRFPHYQRFLDMYCDTYSGGYGTKVGGLRDADRFHADTKDIIIRRTKADVLKDLPALDRKFYHVELNPKLNKAYAQALQELEDLLYSDEGSGFAGGAAKIAIMAKMRHITGIGKVGDCIEFTTEFLMSAEPINTPQYEQIKEVRDGVTYTEHQRIEDKLIPRKIVIFVHHQDVAQILQDQLDKWLIDGGFNKSLMMHSGLDGNRRAALVEQFKRPEYRVLIASTLAAGEGLNLQFCSDAILLERQWNPANEEQAEARFHRFGQENPVSITYMIASGTIDEYFTQLVEEKRSIVAATMDNKQIEWEQQSLMKELAEILVTRDRKKWSL